MASRWNSHEVNPDDEEIDADSFSKMTYRRMAVAHPAEDSLKQDRMASDAFQRSAGPPKDPWGPLPPPAPREPEFHHRGLMSMPVPSQKSSAQTETGNLAGNIRRSESGEETLDAERFPSVYRLERTNFAVTSTRYAGEDLELLVRALKLAFGLAGIDVVEFRPSECTFKCSYQKGSVFLSFMVTVFLAPSQASGLLLEHHDEDGLILVEVQLREGDGLYFSGLFRDLVDYVNIQEGIMIAGTFRYRPSPSHPYGEGLMLESIMPKPPGHAPPLSGFLMQAGGCPGSSGAHPDFAADEPPEELDEEMTEDVMHLSGMIREGFPAVQADAASVVAGLTATDSFRQQLSMDGASSAASALASASARLLVETPHRAARRQASVVVANLSCSPVLRAALLASDNSPSSKGATAAAASSGGGKGVGGGAAHSQAQAGGTLGRGLLDSLVLFAVGGITTTTTTQRVRGRRGEEKAGADEDAEQEEEIGMRRECMRALLGMTESEEARDTKAMKSLLLLPAEPSAHGATDKVLIDQLAACQNVLKGHA